MKIRLKLKLATISTVFIMMFSPAKGSDIEFYPYVDVTYWPLFNFSDALDNGIKNFTLAFVNSAGECSPRWGTFNEYTIDSPDLNMPEKIQKIKEHGGDVFIAFGGAAAGENELPAVCTTVDELVGAYREVIEKTGVYNLDFDVEGQNLENIDRIEKRLIAIKLLQSQFPQLKVTFTLPVMPDGLTEEGIRLLRMALDQGIKFERVNIMAMDYGEDYPATEPGQMAEYAKEAIEAVNKQLKELFIAYGIPFDGELYDKIGVIPMIGRNDVLNEWFYPEDAKELREFCLEKGVAMVSMWSLNRDKPISEGESADTQIYLSTKLSPEDYGDDKFVFAKLLGGIQTSENDSPAVSDDNEDSSNQETDTSSSEENTSENSSETDSSTEEESQNTNYSLNLIDYWSGGSQYKVEVDSNNWQMKITLASGKITDIWNAEIEKAEGNTFTIIPAPWFSGSFGFIATGEEPVVTEISLNGVTQEIEQATQNLEWNVTITSDWGDGYVAQVEVKNTGDEPVFNWQLKMKLTSEITSFWGFTPEREDSTTVIVKPADYNRLIPPGGSIQFGFVAQKSGDIPYPQVQK